MLKEGFKKNVKATLYINVTVAYGKDFNHFRIFKLIKSYLI